MKKVAFWTVAVAAGLLVAGLTVPRFGSYVGLAWDCVAHRAGEMISPETEIARIEKELGKIDGDMRHNFDSLATQQVAVDNLAKDIKDCQKRLENQKANLLTMKEDLQKNTQTISYGGVDYPAERIREKLAREFESYKVADQSVKSKQKLLEEKEAALDASRQKVAEMRSQKEQLQVRLETMKTDLAKVRLEQAKANSKVEFDDSRLGQIKADMDKLNTRIQISKQELVEQARFGTDKDIDVTQKTKSKEVVKEVDEYFGNNGDKVAADK